MKRCIGKGETHEGSTTVFPAPYFEDKASGLILRHYNAAGGSYDGSPRYLFGGDGADTLEGTDHNDGMHDGDHLYGGAGRDHLEGGAGYDTYKADSQDRILDSDGKGMVLLGNTALLGGTRSSDDPEDTYSGGGHTYVLNGGTLTIDGGLVIEQFTNGDLRINLRTSDDPPPEKETPDLEPAERNASPIILDLDGDGIETNPLAGQYYDLDGDGLAERTGWVRADDGLLARDLDNDGRIGSGQKFLQTLAAAGITSIATAYDTRTDLNRAWRLSA
ncbi:hypothetical protein ACNQFN_22400 [Thauera butanivorans]|uniref:hypothetical protein n=1 Tax=Thauera butanivorans TaxID=86174 RepID=UPI003AB22766